MSGVKTLIGGLAFLQGEHLTEELNAHRRSKNSFLDRQDFLHRVDWAQFEIERDVRSKERKRTGAQNM